MKNNTTNHILNFNSKKNICFLTYINRSGSTLLATELNKYRLIGVTPEAEFKDGIHKGRVSISNITDLEKYINTIKKNNKLKKWDLDYHNLLINLQNKDFPILFNDILSEVLNQYFEKNKYDMYIYKRNDYFRYYKKLKKLFPDSLFLFIERDPRAVYNSQKKSLDSLTQRPMAKNIVQFAVRYKKTIDFINRNLVNQEWFLKIKYKNLVKNKEQTLDVITKFLNISSKEKSGKDYFNQIPDDQKHLHKNIKLNKTLVSRIDAWKNELSGIEIQFLQDVLKENIDVNKKINFKLKDKLKLVLYKIIFFVYYGMSMLKKAIYGY